LLCVPCPFVIADGHKSSSPQSTPEVDAVLIVRPWRCAIATGSDERGGERQPRSLPHRPRVVDCAEIGVIIRKRVLFEGLSVAVIAAGELHSRRSKRRSKHGVGSRHGRRPRRLPGDGARAQIILHSAGLGTRARRETSKIVRSHQSCAVPATDLERLRHGVVVVGRGCSKSLHQV